MPARALVCRRPWPMWSAAVCRAGSAVRAWGLDPQRCSRLNGEDRRGSPRAQYLNTRGTVADDPRLLVTVRVHPRLHGAVPLLGPRPPAPRTSVCGGKTCLPVAVTVTE